MSDVIIAYLGTILLFYVARTCRQAAVNPYITPEPWMQTAYLWIARIIDFFVWLVCISMIMAMVWVLLTR